MLQFLRCTAHAIGVLVFVLFFLVFIIQVTARFVFDKPLAWTDEAAVILYIWAVLWGAAVICRDREHVAFDLFYQGAPARVKRAMAILACILVGGLAVWAFPGTVDYIQFMRREFTPVLGLPLHWVFGPFVLLLLALIVRYAIRLCQLLGKHWEQQL